MIFRPSLIFLLSFIFSIVIGFSKSMEADSLGANHFLIKTDVLFPMGLMLEYKTKSTAGFQISGYYVTKPLWKQEYEDLQVAGSYYFTGEIRHYMGNHFICIYIKYAHFEDNISMYAPFKQVYYSFGPLYGYQKEWGRFNLEGLIGLGISQSTQHKGFTKIGLYYFDDEDFYSPFIDLRLSIGIGYRIF